MSQDVNKVILIGHVGQDPRIKTARASGKKMAFVSVATSKRFKDRSGDRRQVTQWHQVCVFDEKLAEEVERTIKKGAHVIVEGELNYRKYQDQDGREKEVAEIVLQGIGYRLELVSGDAAAGGGGSRAPDPDGPEEYGSKPARQPAAPPRADNDEVPF